MKKYKRNPSIIQPFKKKCYFTGEKYDLDPHEPIGGTNRQQSMEHGLWIWVTREKHRWLHDTEDGQYANSNCKMIVQLEWFEKYIEANNSDFEHAMVEWMKIFGRNYLRGD